MSTVAAPSGMRLLVIEDEVQFLELLGRKLSQLGYQVQAAPTGAQALVLAQQQPFDAVIVDGELASMSSVETVRRLQDLWGAAMPPVLYLSLCPRFRHYPQLPAGPAAHLRKPYRMRDLLHQLADLLQTPVL